MAHSPCFFPPLAGYPFVSPLRPLPLTWHPPAVTGIVHLGLRLLVNWPHLPHPSPNCPSPPNSQNPNCPAPYNDDLGNIPALAIRYNKYEPTPLLEALMTYSVWLQVLLLTSRHPPFFVYWPPITYLPSPPAFHLFLYFLSFSCPSSLPFINFPSLLWFSLFHLLFFHSYFSSPPIT